MSESRCNKGPRPARSFARGALTCPRCRNPRTSCYQTSHGTDAQGEALTTRRHQCLDPACAHKFRTTQRHGLRA